MSCILLSRVQYSVDIRVDYAIEYIPTVAAVLNKTCFSHYRKLLRDVGLSKAKMSFHVTNTMLAIPEDIEDRDPCRMGENFEHLSLSIKMTDICFLIFNHIQIHEYNYIPIHYYVKSLYRKTRESSIAIQ